jgi:NADPH-dependent curcumin reductase CurA
MGCCTGSTVDKSGDIQTLDVNQLRKRMTPKELALIIKVQANIRGFIARKQIRQMQYNAGMAGYVHDGEMNDYDNPKVAVSTLPFSLLTPSIAN